MGTANCTCIRDCVSKAKDLQLGQEQTMTRIVPAEKQEATDPQDYEVSTGEQQKIVLQPPTLPLSRRVGLQSAVRGYASRKKLAELPAPDAHSPEMKYKAISTNLKQLFHDSFTKQIDKQYGKLDLSTPLNDVLSVEEKPAFVLENEVVYKGEWNEAGEKHGRGMEVHPDGTRFTGYYVHGQMEGCGRIIHPNQDMYQGEFKKGQASGKGYLCRPNGYKYEGEFKQNLKWGQGKETGADNSTYDGVFVRGKREGFGKLTMKTGDVYEGEFKNNEMEGEGHYKWANGDTFIGSFKQNKPDGRGKFHWADGKSYNGDYMRGLKHGQGLFEWADGRQYEGHFRDGNMDGEGYMISCDAAGTKIKKKGVWKKGKRTAWCD